MGIHLDDVIIEGDNVFGGGVNIAARLESLCEPGCILVSRTVQEKIIKRIKHTIDSLGNSELKNSLVWNQSNIWTRHFEKRS